MPSNRTPIDSPLATRAVEVPWTTPSAAPVFACLWATGPDPTTDGVLRLMAVRQSADGAWEHFDRYADPFPNRSADLAAASRRTTAEFGVNSEDLDSQPPGHDLWPELREFLGDSIIIVPDRAEFAAWAAHLAASPNLSLPLVGLAETAALLLPGRLATRRGDLAHDLLPADITAERASPRALHPADLQLGLTELLRRFHAGEGTAAVAAHGYRRAWLQLAASDPDAAATLAHTLRLVEHPSSWAGSVTGSLPLGELLEDGTLARGLEVSADEGELSWLLEPRWAAEVESWKKLPKLSHKPEGRLPFDAEDLKLLDDIFEVHLPKIFGVPPEIGHRPAQHTVAQETAAVLGRDRDSKRSGVEILLVHAPTGTGKTLAYLIPLLLWSTRHGARTCVATYTRTLQEQAFDSDVPRALQALRRAGLSDDLRVSILKGRENYACWRSTSMQSPDPDAAGEDWLAWTRYLLFCAADTEGDLDRLPETAPIPFADTRSWRNADSGLRRRVRARSGCCRHETDRRTCAAHGARVRAERSHVVITNQAYALTNQEFAHHIVFDECEHLHDQADSVFSHGVTLRELGAVLGRVSGGSGRRRGALDAALKVAHVGGDAYASAEEGVRATESARAALDLLYGEVTRFVAWKKEASRGREDRDTHSLMREFVLSEEGHDLIEARKSLADHLSEVEQSLSALSEHLDELKGRRSAKVRRRLDLARTDLVEIISHISAWIPISEGRISFSTSRYYDAEELPSGDVELMARILLPNEVLGQEYYPNLKTAIFVSATTWLKGGFESARYYLGIDYAELPRPEVEDFLPARVTTFRSPEAFDYSRVIVTAPKDLPHPSRNTAAHLAHIRRYTAYLAERTRGRVLVLFTNSEHVRQVGAELEGFFRARSIPFWYQGMEGASKEELSELFRRTTDSVLLGVDTFWYGADFPGPTLEHLIITKLPFGVPDRYHHAQCAALSKGEHWKKIYMPRALAKFRQGFGRLMRRESDKGVVHILDPRILDPRNRVFQRELPIYKEAAAEEDTSELARFVQGNSSRCLHEALAHMELLADIERRELQLPFEEFQATSAPTSTHSDSDADLLTPFPSSAQEGPNDDYGDRLPSHIDLREFLPWADEGDSTA